MVATTTRSQLRKCLTDVDFPANKQDLLEAAHRNGCDDDTVGALRAIPPETYTNVAQIAASVTIADDTEGNNPSGSAIVDELGENRGS